MISNKEYNIIILTIMSLTTINNSSLVIPESKDQDFVANGKLENGNLWYIVFDGHGTNKVINGLKELDLCSIMSTHAPCDIIEEKVREMGDTFNSGATMSIVIISPSAIKCYWRGDSTIKIWEDNILIFESADHNSSSVPEMERMKRMGINTVSANNLKIIDEKTITVVPSPYFIIDVKTDGLIEGLFGERRPRNDQVNMTNCLGHNGRTGGFASINRTNMKEDKEYCVIAASDGVWDVMAPRENLSIYSNAADVASLARTRWRQPWTYEYPGYEPEITTMPEGDDIGVAMWKGKITRE